MTSRPAPLFGAARWGALALAVAGVAHRPRPTSAETAATVGLLAIALWRTARSPVAARRSAPIDAAAATAAVMVTGVWSSPFLPCLLPPVLGLGLEEGGRSALALAAGVAALLTGARPSASAVGWATELVLVAALGGHVRRLQLRADVAAAQAEAGVVSERTRMARELHDGVAQELACVAFELDRLAATDAHTPAPAALRAVAGTVRSVLGELRQAVAELRAEASGDRDLAAALVTFANQVERRSGLRVDLDFTVRSRPRPAVQRELLQIAEEAVRNAERHARGSHVAVSLREQREGQLVLAVADDGHGVVGPPPAGHFGLLGMRERAAALGGNLEVRAAPGRGTIVRCEIPA